MILIDFASKLSANYNQGRDSDNNKLYAVLVCVCAVICFVSMPWSSSGTVAVVVATDYYSYFGSFNCDVKLQVFWLESCFIFTCSLKINWNWNEDWRRQQLWECARDKKKVVDFGCCECVVVVVVDGREYASRYYTSVHLTWIFVFRAFYFFQFFVSLLLCPYCVVCVRTALALIWSN